MYAPVLADGTNAAIQTVYVTILVAFFILVILSWLVASRDWFKDEITSTEVFAESGDLQNDLE